MTTHVTIYEESHQMKKVVGFVQPRGKAGATTQAIYYKTRVCSIPQIFYSLKSPLNGFIVDCRFERTTKHGARVFRWWVLGRKPSKEWMAARRAAGIKLKTV